MTYASFETSIEGSRPVELFHFMQGLVPYNYTSSQTEITVDGTTYRPETIQRDRLTSGPEERSVALEIRLPANNELIRRFIRIAPPPDETTLQIYRIQRSDTPTPEVRTLFDGIVQGVAFEKNGTIGKMLVLPLTGLSARALPRFTYQGKCNHVLYDGRCKMVAASFSYAATVSAVSGRNVTLPGAGAFATDYFLGGFMEAADGDSRMIVDQSGDVLTLHIPFSTSPLGQLMTAFAGCDHTIAGTRGCGPKFDNVNNYGGWAWVPKKNPFATGIV